MTQPMVDAAAAQGIDPDLLWPVLGVDRDYLDTAFAEVERAFGSFDGYLRQGLGLTDDVLAALTARLVTTG
jgi:protein-tyrosine phosphatase